MCVKLLSTRTCGECVDCECELVITTRSRSFSIANRSISDLRKLDSSTVSTMTKTEFIVFSHSDQ